MSCIEDDHKKDRIMLINLFLPGAKGWKSYWVNINKEWLEIAEDCDKGPFTAFHIGILRAKPSKDFPDRPDVLEFFDGEGFANIHFYAFSYDPFDFYEFTKFVSSSFRNWQDTVMSSRQTKTYSCEVKSQKKFFSTNSSWQVCPDRIRRGKNSEITFSEITNVIPCSSSSHSFKFVTKREEFEERCPDLATMKELLGALYNNMFIWKSITKN